MEVFKKIKGFKKYEISNYGKVKSLKGKKERILKEGNCNGYRQVLLTPTNKSKRKAMKVHWLVIDAFKGRKPNMVIDHINNKKADNRLINLRQVDMRLNSSDVRGVSKYTGVSRSRNKWKARILINGIRKYLGTFETEILASEAYQNELLKLN